MYGSYIAGSIGLLNWLVAISLGVWSSVAQVGNHIADYSSDKNSGTRTFAVWAGLDKAKIAINILTFLHLVILLPLVLFYSIQYYATSVILIIIAILGLIILRPKIGTFPSRRCWIFYFTIVIGGGVYVSVILCHIYNLLNVPPLDLLKFSFI